MSKETSTRAITTNMEVLNGRDETQTIRKRRGEGTYDTAPPGPDRHSGVFVVPQWSQRRPFAILDARFERLDDCKIGQRSLLVLRISSEAPKSGRERTGAFFRLRSMMVVGLCSGGGRSFAFFSPRPRPTGWLLPPRQSAVGAWQVAADTRRVLARGWWETVAGEGG